MDGVSICLLPRVAYDSYTR